MNKKFCDKCGKEAPLNGHDSSTYCSEVLQIDEKLLCDEKAKIEIHVRTGFKNHSTGFGGPPDLCPDCFVECFRLLGEKIVNWSETIKNRGQKCQ